MIWHIVTAISICWALYAIIRHRKQVTANLKRLPVWARFAFGALLIVCAFIPGPVDDLIIVGLIVKLGKE